MELETACCFAPTHLKILMQETRLCQTHHTAKPQMHSTTHKRKNDTRRTAEAQLFGVARTAVIPCLQSWRARGSAAAHPSRYCSSCGGSVSLPAAGSRQVSSGAKQLRLLPVEWHGAAASPSAHSGRQGHCPSAVLDCLAQAACRLATAPQWCPLL